jgi:ER-bound oxygenase mpaB/B'/Rubber oxygenase, catalytic domain
VGAQGVRGWFYTVGTPATGIAPAVIDAVYRGGAGKYASQPTKRRDDSNDHMMLWFEHGPDAAATKKSVQMVNKYHAHFARSYPDGFANPEDYLYILCLNATLVHAAERSLRLPGFSPRQKRAMYLFWSQLAEHFTTPEGRPITEQMSFPADFEAMETLVQSYQARPWPVH